MKRIKLAVAIAGAAAVLGLAASGQGRESHSAGSLVPTATMSVGRFAHTATALLDGRVLVAGGLEMADTDGAEIYDAEVGRFSSLPPMLATRQSHTATLLRDGKVLIAGGYGERSTVGADEGRMTLANAEVFDPKTNSFASTGSLVTARSGHVATLLNDGKVLIIGGLGADWQFLSSAELYDPMTGKFSTTGSMNVARESHVAVRLLDARVLIVGGHRDRRENIKVYASAEIYNPSKGVFSSVGDMNIRRHKHDAVLLADGRVLITGGSDARDGRGRYDSSEFFDPKSDTFVVGPKMNLHRYKHAGSSVLLHSGLVLIAGGARQAEIYDPRINAFLLVGGETRIAGQFAAAAPLNGGGVLITGGYGNPSVEPSAAWLYRP